jgi:hypothetical protein
MADSLMIVAVLICCVLVAPWAVWAWRRVRKAIASRRAARWDAFGEAFREAVREALFQQALGIWNSVPPELLPELITHPQEDFDD